MPDKASVLVVDDDADIRDLLSDYLEAHGYAVRTACDGVEARARLVEQVPQVVMLDVGLPGEDGLSLARHLRENYDVGIMMVSGAGDTVDRIIGLEVGADDYIAKPFDLRELRARLKSLLRRYARSGEAETAVAAPSIQAAETARRVRFGLCTLDLDSCLLASAEGAEVPITRAEFELLRVFAQRPNRALSREQLFSLAQNRDWDPMDRSLDIRIARLRKKIEANPDHPVVLRTVRGVGYMYAPDAS